MTSISSGQSGIERFGPIPMADMSPRQRKLVAAALQRARDASATPTGPLNALLRSPEMLDGVQQFIKLLRLRSSLPTRLIELGILVTARNWTAQYVWHSHRSMAIAAGLDPAIVDAIAHGEQPAELDEPAAAVYQFASQLLATGGVDDETFAAVRDRFGEVGAVDLIGLLGYYCLISFLVNVDRCFVPEGEPMLAPISR
jgi:4-carboxymuconolactone decarboxylase